MDLILSSEKPTDNLYLFTHGEVCTFAFSVHLHISVRLWNQYTYCTITEQLIETPPYIPSFIEIANFFMFLGSLWMKYSGIILEQYIVYDLLRY